MKLERTIQCEKCPWRIDTDPREIPNGYSVEMHRALAETIAEPGDLCAITGDGPRRAMACHEFPPGGEVHCVGWLVNQLGVGNNLAWRLALMECENAHELRTLGEQHERFEDTLPELEAS